jgi:hypothetical protein
MSLSFWQDALLTDALSGSLHTCHSSLIISIWPSNRHRGNCPVDLNGEAFGDVSFAFVVFRDTMLTDASRGPHHTYLSSPIISI